MANLSRSSRSHSLAACGASRVPLAARDIESNSQTRLDAAPESALPPRVATGRSVQSSGLANGLSTLRNWTSGDSLNSFGTAYDTCAPKAAQAASLGSGEYLEFVRRENASRPTGVGPSVRSLRLNAHQLLWFPIVLKSARRSCPHVTAGFGQPCSTVREFDIVPIQVLKEVGSSARLKLFRTCNVNALRCD